MDELKFRNLVTNQFMENIDYSREKYSFRTVFYKSSSTYCCCSCAHNHEYLEYISDTGEVDENVYENIVKSLANGKCPHADMVPEYQLVPTSITAMHIAAAVGTERAVRENIDKCFPSPRYMFSCSMLNCGIFKLPPLDTAMLKKQTNICNLIVDYGLSHESIYTQTSNIYISTVNSRTLHIKEGTRLELCVRQRNNQLLQAMTTDFGYNDMRKFSLILNPDSSLTPGLVPALHFTLKNNLVTLQHSIVHYMQRLDKYNLLSFVCKNDCLVSVLMYNSQNLLEQMLDVLHLNDSNGNTFISKCCMVLQKRGECKKLLHHHGVIQQVSMSSEEHVNTIFALCLMFYNDFKDELYNMLETAPCIQQGVVRVALLKQIRYCGRYMYGHRNCVELAQTITELGNSETLVSDAGIIVPQLQAMLRDCSTYGMFNREAIELLVAENVEFKNEIDYRLEVPLHEFESYDFITDENEIGDRYIWDEPMYLVRSYNYITDVREHGMYGHDGENLALNYVYPFLLECGYKIPRRELQNFLDEISNTESKSIEVAYINNYLETPRSLQTCCRNTLRNHFRGRYIHRFVEVSGCPQKIKDFILLKDLLRCIR